MLTSELQASLAIANPDSQVFVVLNYQRYAVRSVSLEEIGVVVLVDPLPIAELERKWLMKGFAIALIAGLVLATLSIAAEPKACECGTSCACSVRNNCGCLVSAGPERPGPLRRWDVAPAERVRAARQEPGTGRAVRP